MGAANEDAARRRDALDQAGRWLSRMRGEPGTDDHVALAAWRAADPIHEQSYQTVLRNWEADGFVLTPSSGLSRDLSRAQVWHRRPAARYGIAASLALVAIGAGSIWTFAPYSEAKAVFYSNEGQGVRSVALADGSKVVLDRKTRLSATFTTSARQLELQTGRARFDVARDATRPFVVSAGGGMVRTNGALFDIDCTAALARVTAWAGTLDIGGKPGLFGTGSRTRPLSSGRSLSIVHGVVASSSELARAADVRWVSGMLAFDATSLGDAVGAFNQRNRVQLAVRSARIAALKVSGAFRADDPTGFARSMALLFKLGVRRQADGTLLLIEVAEKK